MLKTTAVAASLAALAATARAEPAEDPFLWLEEVDGERAIEWVKKQNAETLPKLTSSDAFKAMHEEAEAILTSKSRLAGGQIHHGSVYNFWQDDEHVRGVWRRSPVGAYRSGEPEWETILDYDALAAAEDRNWIAGTIACLTPAYVHCMVELSDGGKDAGIWREFNTATKSFVDGGFALDEAKSWVAWIDENALLVGADTGEASLTTSGYPRILRIWPRDEDVASAQVFAEGAAEDVAVWPQVEIDAGISHLFALRAVSFFETEFWHAAGAGGEKQKLPVPRNVELEGVLDGRAIFLLREPWEYDGESFAQGSVVAYDLASGRAESVMGADASQSIEAVGIGETGLVIQYLDDVSGNAARLTRAEGGEWTSDPIPMPEKGVIKVVSSGGGTDDAILSFESLTVPGSLFYAPAETEELETIAQSPAFYDASGVVVEQRFATSKDGTRVPYFIMAKEEVLEEGDAPTVQYGYGGFLSATLPVYYEDPARPQHGALAGKLWIARGGVLVLSNIRGGSEYGPGWHEAALKENRQRAFDDFIAISEDLIETGVTTPQKLGAVGRSNGGLLLGAIMTQRPELYGALDIGSPLFDMKRYNKLLAGASWMGEYGNPDIEEEWAYISRYSPYQNLEAGKNYPKVLFYTSTKDDRVHPGHARKAAAKMAALGYPYFYYENIEGGHGGTANQKQLAYRIALEYAYFAHMLMDDSK